MATTVIRKVTKELMREVRDSVHEQERRYLQNETNRQRRTISWKLERNPNSANSWEYKVVTRGWVINPKEKQRRLLLGRIGCYTKTLERLFESKGVAAQERSQPEWGETTENAIQGLIRLRNIEQLYKESRREDSRTTKVETNMEQQRQQTDEEGVRDRQKQRLYSLWKEFVTSTRIREGWYDRLPTLGEGKCLCGKAKISYPHWPPTSTNEADAQFEYSINERNTHRRPLVISWWRHFNEFANMKEWTASESQQRYKEAETIVREASPIVQQELERTTKIQKRPKGWSCREYCEKVLTEKKCECLCFCVEHHDECPTHGRQ